MDNILFINGPITKYIQQVCDCEESRAIDDTSFDGTTMLEDKITTIIIVKKDICSICGTSYKVWYDGSNCFLLQNVGDSNA